MPAGRTGGGRLHYIVLAGCLAYLAAAWAAVVAVDVLNGAGTRDALSGSGLQMPHVWYHLFKEGGPTEVLQWSALGATAVVGAFTAGLAAARGDRPATLFWVLLGVTGALLLLEDAGNVRHTLRPYAYGIIGDSRAVSVAVEVAWYGLIAAVPLYAVARYWRVPWRAPAARWALLGGFVVYGVAALSSATRDVGGLQGWYAAAGAFLQERVFGGRLLSVSPIEGQERFWPAGSDPTGYVLMDSLVEESVELVAASLLLASAVAFLQHYRGSRGGAPAADALMPETPSGARS